MRAEWLVAVAVGALMGLVAACGRIMSAVRENLAKLKELLESGATTLQDGRRVTA